MTIIGTIASQISLITALFYYFGWVYIHSFYSYFGVDTNLLSYSAVDYVMRSINVTFFAFMYLAFIVLALFACHRRIMVPALTEDRPELPLPPRGVASGMSSSVIPLSARLGSSRVADMMAGWVRLLGHWRLGSSGARRIIGGLRILAIILVLVVFAGVPFPERFGIEFGPALPLFLMFSVSALGYVEHVRSKYPDVLTTTTISWPAAHSRMYTSTLLALGLVAGLWAVSLYGDQVGSRLAVDFSSQLPERSGVVIYSTQRIDLNGPGVHFSDITLPDAKYHFQYTGLRLLTHTSDKFLLLPARWQHGRDRVFLLRDDDSIRADIVAR